MATDTSEIYKKKHHTKKKQNNITGFQCGPNRPGDLVLGIFWVKQPNQRAKYVCFFFLKINSETAQQYWEIKYLVITIYATLEIQTQNTVLCMFFNS